jgi:nicotinamide-nucleotide adenylyltransferase
MDIPLDVSPMIRALEGLAAAPRQLAFVRRARTGTGPRPGTLLCLSASFNPLTSAHWALVEAAQRRVPGDEVLLVLALANVDKAITGLPPAVRLALLTRFAQDRPAVSVAVTDSGRFVDKLAVVQEAYPPGTRILFLLGFDTLVRLFDRKYYTDRDAALIALFAGSECVVADRPPDRPEAVRAFLARPDVARFASRIHHVQLPPDLAQVSATRVRTGLAAGAMPDCVPAEIRPLLAAWADTRRQRGTDAFNVPD